MRMKSKVFLYAVLSFVAMPAPAEIPDPVVRKINNQVYALLGPVGLPSKENHGYMVNSTVLVGDKGVVLIDTGFTDEIGRHIKKTVAGITDKPITHIINTHHHGDHVLGNSEFAGAQIISSEECRKWVEKASANWIASLENRTGYKFPNTRPVLADKVYPQNTRETVTLQGIAMQLIVPAGSHSPGDMMIYLPQFKLLVSGDILVKSMMPSFVDAHVKTWLATLREIAKMDIESVIPGHGPLLNKKDISAMARRMDTFYAGVDTGYKKGMADFEIRRSLDLSAWKDMAAFDDLMGIAINRTYLEIEAENF